MKTKAILLALSLVLLMSIAVIADVPDEITYQGRLLYNGNPVTTATSIVFRLYQTSSGGSAVWSEIQGSVTPDSNGIYTVVLGSTVAIPDGYDALWIELEVAGNSLTPRKKLTSAPFVLRAGELPDLYVSGNVGIGTTNPGAKLHLSGGDDGDIYSAATIALGHGSTGLYPHFIHTIHSTIPNNNGIDFYTYDGTLSGTGGYPTNAVHGMTIRNGNVGIGTTGPSAKLDVVAGDATVLELHKTASGVAAMIVDGGYIITDGGNYGIRGNAGHNMYLGANNTDYMVIGSTGGLSFGTGYLATDPGAGNVAIQGNVGIGTTSPGYKMSFGPAINNNILALAEETTGAMRGIGAIQGSGQYGIGFWASLAPITPGMSNTSMYVSANTGNVGIGTTTPNGKLDVNGAIYQRGGVLHGDYVFEEGFELETIEEHSRYMWKNKHLEAIPKAAIDEEGREIVEVGAHRRGIVEELEKAHIYIEQLQEQIKELRKEFGQLRKVK